MKMLKRLWVFITSYPMDCRVRCQFVDVVSGQSVGIYVDKHGKEWLAEHSMALFRVERQCQS